MNRKIISPFDGEPKTEQFIDENGNTAFRIRAQAITPEQVKKAELWAVATILWLMGMGFQVLTENPDASPLAWFAFLIGPILAYPILNDLFRSSYYTETRIEMTIDEFRIKRFPGWQRFDRTLPHRFALLVHDKTQKEKDANELAVRQAQARGQVVAPKRYYGDSFHVSFEYLGQRNDVMNVYGHKDALAIVARLKACDDILDGEARMGDGIALDPEDQWSKGPGEI
ncbi:MAG: hypothetical protein JAZ17_03545 [Candidatus Thiodiazotropha endolucinida]|nr:hypothetical protein [Candidatus Thiodiazotropha taylori]MCG8092695.1 hypothetical protein [Candidatus Thiodiazotropha endolucinida]MCG8046022.1 hypothetical protein [Candidatus Thiodiazotropha taylori]MCG8053127.1 hypothetical protein [Candidatus Thiodiazotropha taylori]MCG8072794.1 hypothetical protein [Candidatus Thiodiazotropha taylori]